MVVIALFNDPVDVGNGRRDKERDGECRDVKAGGPKTDKDGVDDTKDGEPPADALKGDLSARVRKLVKDEAEEKEVDKGPDAECPVRRGDVRLLGSVRVLHARAGGQWKSAEDEVHLRGHLRQSRRCYLGRGSIQQHWRAAHARWWSIRHRRRGE